VQWLRPLIDRPLADRLDESLRDTVDANLDGGHGNDLERWLPTVLRQVGSLRTTLQQRADDAAYRWAFTWHRTLQHDLEEALLRTVTASGLAAGRELLQLVAASTSTWAADLQAEAGRAPLDLTAAPKESQGLLGGKGRVTVGPEITERLRQGFRRQMWQGLQGRASGHAASVLLSLGRDLVQPMSDDALELLLEARKAPPLDAGLARVETDEYASWPTSGEGDLVPIRFAQAHNEVLLMKAVEYPERFDQHVDATHSDLQPGASQRRVVEQVVSGRWDTAGVRVVETVLTPLATWRPGALGRDPDDARAVTSPMVRAQYRWAVRPEQVLARSRRWVRTEQQPFDAFIRQSLEQYLRGEEVNEAERDRRSADLRSRFREALALAQPLVAVSPATVGAQHFGLAVQVSYKFGPLPFAGHALAEQLLDDMQQSPSVEPTTHGRFSSALTTGSPTTRIDLFGAHSNLSPACFSSLLAPLDRHWASCVSPEARRGFFDMRRARRMPGGLPMGDAQRKALVAGWYVARLTGRLRLPSEHHGAAVEVWDAEMGEWVAFPHPLLVDEGQFEVNTDVLPAVLLSSLLALAKSHQYPHLEPFRPYTVLRRTWDAGLTPRHDRDAVLGLAAGEVLRTALMGAARPPGGPTRPAEAEQLWTTQTPEQRRAHLVEQLQQLQAHLGQQYLPPGAESPGGGEFSVFTRAEQLLRVPYLHELAPDVHWALGRLLELLSALQLDSLPATRGPLLDPALG
jgi:hypothetical protein